MHSTPAHRTLHRKRLALLPLAAMLLTVGCATATRIPLKDGTPAGGASVKTIIALSQQELGVSIVPATGGAAFGIVGALVDANTNKSRMKVAEDAVVPVRNALVGVEAGPALRSAIARELAPVSWLKGGAIELRQATEAKTDAAIVTEAGTDLVLAIAADYRLTPEFDAMVITARVTLLGKPPPPPSAPVQSAYVPPGQSAGAADPAPPAAPKLYFNTVWTQAALPGWTPEQKPTLDEAAKRWAADGGALARRALEGGIAELARMIAFDLGQGSPGGSATATYDEPSGAKVVTAAGKYALGAAKGFVVREENGRAWWRVANGELSASGAIFP